MRTPRRRRRQRRHADPVGRRQFPGRREGRTATRAPTRASRWKSNHPTGGDTKDAVAADGPAVSSSAARAPSRRPRRPERRQCPARRRQPDNEDSFPSTPARGRAATASRGRGRRAILRPAATRQNLLVTAPPPGPGASAGEGPNLEFARKQTDLALEYFRDQMAKDKSSLLEQLGWNREDAEGFLRRWDEMKRAAGQQGPEWRRGAEVARRGHQEPGPAP